VILLPNMTLPESRLHTDTCKVGHSFRRRTNEFSKITHYSSLVVVVRFCCM